MHPGKDDPVDYDGGRDPDSMVAWLEEKATHTFNKEDPISFYRFMVIIGFYDIRRTKHDIRCATYDIPQQTTSDRSGAGPKREGTTLSALSS